MVGDQLEHVEVAGHDRRVEAAPLRVDGDGADHVVRLEAGQLVDRQAERLDHLADLRELVAEVVRHALAGRLVLGVLLVAERRALEVEGDRDVVRADVLDAAEHDAAEAEHRVDELALRRRQGREGEVSAVDEPVAVEQHQAVHRQASGSVRTGRGRGSPVYPWPGPGGGGPSGPPGASDCGGVGRRTGGRTARSRRAGPRPTRRGRATGRRRWTGWRSASRRRSRRAAVPRAPAGRRPGRCRRWPRRSDRATRRVPWSWSRPDGAASGAWDATSGCAVRVDGGGGRRGRARRRRGHARGGGRARAALAWPSAALPTSSWLGAEAAALAAAVPAELPNDGSSDGAVPTSTPTRPSVVRPTASGRERRSFGDPIRSSQPRRPPRWRRRASASVSW